MTVSAPVRFTPRPPLRVERMKQKMRESALNRSINTWNEKQKWDAKKTITNYAPFFFSLGEKWQLSSWTCRLTVSRVVQLFHTCLLISPMMFSLLPHEIQQATMIMLLNILVFLWKCWSNSSAHLNSFSSFSLGHHMCKMFYFMLNSRGGGGGKRLGILLLPPRWDASPLQG